MNQNQFVQVPQEQMRTLDSAVKSASERIIKHAANHGKIQRVLKDAEGKDVVVSEFDFGADHVYRALAEIEGKLLQWKDDKWIASQIAELEAQKVKVLEMKTVLERA